jgi:hypothetical protein
MSLRQGWVFYGQEIQIRSHSSVHPQMLYKRVPPTYGPGAEVSWTDE